MSQLDRLSTLLNGDGCVVIERGSSQPLRLDTDQYPVEESLDADTGASREVRRSGSFVRARSFQGRLVLDEVVLSGSTGSTKKLELSEGDEVLTQLVNAAAQVRAATSQTE